AAAGLVVMCYLCRLSLCMETNELVNSIVCVKILDNEKQEVYRTKELSQYVSYYVPEEGDLRTAGGQLRRRSEEQEEMADLAER
ncbi:hypothetical protein GBF38_003483, partial [Nibea albiflora]